MVTQYGAKGTTLYVTAASSAWVEVGQISSINAPGSNVGKREVTTLSSSAKEYRPTVSDPQEISGSIVYTNLDDGARQMYTYSISPPTSAQTWSVTGVEFKIVLQTTTFFWRFPGFVTKFDPKAGDVEGTWMADFSIQPTGTITVPTTV